MVITIVCKMFLVFHEWWVPLNKKLQKSSKILELTEQFVMRYLLKQSNLYVFHILSSTRPVLTNLAFHLTSVHTKNIARTISIWSAYE